MTILLGAVLLLTIVASVAATGSPGAVITPSNTTLPVLGGTTNPVYHIWAATSVVLATQLVTLIVIVFRTRAKRTVVSQSF